MAQAKLEVLLQLQDKASKQLSEFQNNLNGMKNQFRVAGGAMVGFAGLVGGASLKMGMEAVESENLFEVAMGGMADKGRAFSEGLRDQLGLNSYEVRENMATIYQMASSMGLGEDAAYDMASGLTQLAYDMASFYNLAPEEAFQKLQAGITGEAEPLKRLGILVNENTIQQVAYNNGLAEQGDQLTDQEKVQARFLAILDQTANAQGDLARTIDSPTNRLRIFKSQIQETGITLGMALLPAFEKILDIAKPIIDAISTWIEENPKLASTILIVVGALGGILLALSFIGPALTALSGPVGLAILAFTLLVAAGVAIWQNWDTIKEKAIEIWNSIADFFKGIWETITGFFQEHWDKILAILFPAVGLPILIARHWGDITEAVSEIWEKVKEVFSGIWETAFEWGENLVQGLWEGILSLGSWIRDQITDFFEDLWGNVTDFFEFGSPSKLAMRAGENVILGFGEGVNRGAAGMTTTTQNYNVSFPGAVVREERDMSGIAEEVVRFMRREGILRGTRYG
jgi:hypothetical protein